MAEKKKGFDLAAALANVSKLDTSGSREQIEYIDINAIDSDPNNFYSLSGLEELASNIALLGLQQPLRVRPNPDDPTRVVIVSGHRRRAAIQKLIAEGQAEFSQVPCIRDVPARSAALQELRLIYANSDTRKMTDMELLRQAERVEILLYQLKEEGYDFPGRMRDQVAAACQVSAPKLARLKVIREKLVAGYMALFEKNRLPEQTAYALARLPREFQERLARILPEPPSGRAAEKLLQKYSEGWRWEPALTCPDGKECKRGDTFLRRDCECDSWRKLCGGQICCLECEQAKGYSPCERLCSRAKAQKKAERGAGKEREQERKRAAGRKYQEETRRYARRLLRAIEAAGLPEEQRLLWDYYGGYSVASIRQWAAGEFDDPADWSFPRLVPGKCREPAEMAKTLHCSTDFLLGLTEELGSVEAPATQEEEAEATAAEELAEDGAGWETMLDEIAQEEPPVRRFRWETRGRTPPEGRPILTYRMTSDGPEYRPAVWTGSVFQKPNGRAELPGLRYTHWLELPPPGSGAALEAAEGQVVFAAWMPGGTLPAGPCDVVADFRTGDGTDDVTVRNSCWYDGANFRFSRSGAKIEAEVVRWITLPPVEGATAGG